MFTNDGVPAVFGGSALLDCNPPVHPHKWMKSEAYLMVRCEGDMSRLILRTDICGDCGIVRVPQMHDLRPVFDVKIQENGHG